MKRLCSEQEVLLSWRRCIKAGVSGQVKYLEGEELQGVLDENSQLISTFQKCVSRLNRLISNDCTIFMLTDFKGILLKKNWKVE